MAENKLNTHRQEQRRSFVKMQGLGNHFIIIDGREQSFRPDKKMISRLCSVNTGIGAEQVVVIESAELTGAQARIRIYNTDGKEAEACGNATRCVARLLMESENTQEVVLEIAHRLITCTRQEDLVQVDMGKVSFDWKSIPMSEQVDNFYSGYETMAANVGNPHVVLLVSELAKLGTDERISIGQSIQQHEALVESANVGFAEVVNPETLNLQVYERPGLLTLACGSGACVAVAVALRKGLVNSENVTVQMPGGDLIIDCDDSLNVKMTGPAEYCFEGYFQEEIYA